MNNYIVQYGKNGRECIATKFIPKDTNILQETPFYIGICEFENFKKQIKNDLPAANKMINLAPQTKKIDITLDETNIDDYLDILFDKYETNRFEYENVLGCLVYFGSFFNHSCEPNLTYSQFEGTLIFKTTRDVKCGEEITVTYIDIGNTYEKRKRQLGQWGILCVCKKCIVEKNEIILKLYNAFFDGRMTLTEIFNCPDIDDICYYYDIKNFEKLFDQYY